MLRNRRMGQVVAPPERALVLDIGKATSTISLWDDRGELLACDRRENDPCSEMGLKWLDFRGIEAWLIDCLRKYKRERVTRIIPVAHGAAAAVLVGNSLLAAPMDYDADIDPAVRETYDTARDPFFETGSPKLPGALNLGVQLHQLESLFGPLPARAVIIPWPQYWAWRLSGVLASEVGSLGCHSDLWRPASREFSQLAVRRGWAQRMAPLREASAVLGPVRSEITSRTGLPRECKVLCGLHDSNAALLAALDHKNIVAGELSVVVTGERFVAMRVGADQTAWLTKTFDETTGRAVYVDVHGLPLQAAQFMAGQEFGAAGAGDTSGLKVSEDSEVLIARLFQLITNFKPNDAEDQRVAAHVHLAFMTDRLLDLVRSEGNVFIAGPFAESAVFTRALATLRRDQRIFVPTAQCDVARGALQLLDSKAPAPAELSLVAPLNIDSARYETQWGAGISEAQADAPNCEMRAVL